MAARADSFEDLALERTEARLDLADILLEIVDPAVGVADFLFIVRAAKNFIEGLG